MVRRNRDFVSLILGSVGSHNGQNEEARATSKAHRQAADELLKLDNGDWSDVYHITHHCGGIGCCSGVVETRNKIWLAVLDSRDRIR